MVVRLCCTGAKCYGYKVTLRRLKVNPRRWILRISLVSVNRKVS